VSLLDLIALAFAAHALAYAWTKKDGLFWELLDRISAWGSYTPSDLVAGVPKRWPYIKHKISEGLQCRVCLSYHTAFWLGLIFFGPSFFCSAPIALLWKLPIYSLAATRIALWCFESNESL